jgi:prevent-host-death family protein
MVMADLSTVDAREHFSELLKRVAYGKERIIPMRRGKALVAVLPAEDLRRLESVSRVQEVHDDS